jgi:HPt (histidine-containing phosphotransfer) domain-containing protein/PAS domain-containing protein
MIRIPSWLKYQRGPLAFAVLLLVFAVTILLPGFRVAGKLDDTAAATRLVSEQRRQPDVIIASLTAARDRLDTFGYVDEPLEEIRHAVADLDALVATLRADPNARGAFEASASRALRSPERMEDVNHLARAWADYRVALAPLIAFKGMPYSDSESKGTQLNAAGQRLGRELGAAMTAARRHTAPLVEATGRLSAALEAQSSELSTSLRYMMMVALTITVGLGLGLAYFMIARRREAGMLADAQRQTADILRTVKDGLFLLDAQGRIGAAHSASLARLFKRERISGLSLDELLEPIVSQKTLETASKFIDVLWSERTRENLVRSINPLQEVEVSFESTEGQHETRYLEFDFHRVKSEGKLVSLLVTVNDVTQRVLLARELEHSREKSQSQLDTLLGILHLDPQQLRSFLDDSDAAMKMINAILREPAREESAFRRKLDSIFRQIHSMKGEAAALGLGTVETRAHEFEDSLKELKDRNELSGGDFLPLVVKLDDLFTHLASIRDLVQRLASLQSANSDVASDPEAEMPRAERAAAVREGGPVLLQTLAQLVQRLGSGRGKQAMLDAEGLEQVPAEYRRALKDIAVQIVRNAMVHGIETPEVRTNAGKPAAGTIKVEFRPQGADGYRLLVEDDGAGLSAKRIREAAVAKGMLSSAEAAALDQRAMLGLLFRAGFSTMDEADEDGGRGVGMNVVADLVKGMKGRIAVASAEGRYTRFTILLPHPTAARNAA